jgi:Tfp pilus assembly protein PilF
MNGFGKGTGTLVFLAMFSVVLAMARGPQSGDPLAARLEMARRTRNEMQLQSLKTELEERTRQSQGDAQNEFELAKVQGYLADVYLFRKDKKAAAKAIDSAVEWARRSIADDNQSARAHSLLADLYGRISFGGMLAGPKFGPKVSEENKRAMALDDHNPQVWASQGRQYLMAPKMFGGDVSKAIESFQKSLSLDALQDETYVWLAKAYEQQGENSKAREAIQQALRLNPESPLVKNMSPAF